MIPFPSSYGRQVGLDKARERADRRELGEKRGGYALIWADLQIKKHKPNAYALLKKKCGTSDDEVLVETVSTVGLEDTVVLIGPGGIR